MDAIAWRSVIEETKARAAGRWGEIMRAHGFPQNAIERINQPCPFCGGTDRFSFYSDRPDGSWYCRRCEHGDGIALLMKWEDATFFETLSTLRRELGLPAIECDKHFSRESDPVDDEPPKWLADWESAVPLSELDKENPVFKYFWFRKIDIPEGVEGLRAHPCLPYWDTTGEEPQKLGDFPALLGLLTDNDGTPVSLHRTYLTENGLKAPVPAVKKLVAGGKGNGLIRTSPIEDTLGVAEGIETALGAWMLFHVPVWSAVNVGGFKTFDVPEGVKCVRIFGDNDKTYVGQSGAYELAARLKRERPDLEVVVDIPRVENFDWADVAKSYKDKSAKKARSGKTKPRESVKGKRKKVSQKETSEKWEKAY